MSTPMRPCTSTTKSGSPCAMPALRGRTVCYSHASDRATARRRARARKAGARARGAQLSRGAVAAVVVDGEAAPSWWDLAKASDVEDLLRAAARDVWRGRLDPRSAFALLGIAQALKPALPEAPREGVEIVIDYTFNPDEPPPGIEDALAHVPGAAQEIAGKRAALAERLTDPGATLAPPWKRSSSS